MLRWNAIAWATKVLVVEREQKAGMEKRTINQQYILHFDAIHREHSFHTTVLFVLYRSHNNSEKLDSLLRKQQTEPHQRNNHNIIERNQERTNERTNRTQWTDPPFTNTSHALVRPSNRSKG